MRAQAQKALEERDEANRVAYEAERHALRAQSERDEAIRAEQMAEQAARDAESARDAANCAAERANQDIIRISAARDEAMAAASATERDAEKTIREINHIRDQQAQALRNADAAEAKADMAMLQARYAREAADRAEAKAAVMAQDNESLVDKLTELLVNFELANSKAADLLGQHELLLKGLSDTEAALMNAQTDLKRQSALLQAIEYSTSWRFSKPIRVVGTLFRKVRRKT